MVSCDWSTAAVAPALTCQTRRPDRRSTPIFQISRREPTGPLAKSTTNSGRRYIMTQYPRRFGTVSSVINYLWITARNC